MFLPATPLNCKKRMKLLFMLSNFILYPDLLQGCPLLITVAVRGGARAVGFEWMRVTTLCHLVFQSYSWSI